MSGEETDLIHIDSETEQHMGGGSAVPSTSNDGQGSEI